MFHFVAGIVVSRAAGVVGWEWETLGHLYRTVASNIDELSFRKFLEISIVPGWQVDVYLGVSARGC